MSKLVPLKQEPEIRPTAEYLLLSQNIPGKIGEIIVPDTVQPHYRTWAVKSVGPEVENISVGDTVIVRPQSNIYECGENLYLVLEGDIIATQHSASCAFPS